MVQRIFKGAARGKKYFPSSISKMKIKELDDELGKGIGAYLDGKFFEIRYHGELQSRIFGDNNDSNAVVIAGYKDSEIVYSHFKTFTDRINHLFEISIANRREDFIRYLNKGFEKSFGAGKIRVNPAYKGLEELKKYTLRQATKYGVLAEGIGWLSLMSLSYVNLKMMAVIMGFYFVFGDVICGLLLSWLADLGTFTSPFFQLGAYPAERRLFKKYVFLDRSLLAYFKKKGERLRRVEEEFGRTRNVERKSLLSRRLERENEKLSKAWVPVALSFAKSNELKGIIVEYKGRYQDSFALLNYIINGVEPREEELDIWRIKIEEPQKREEEETDFDKIWGKQEKKGEDK